MNKIDLLNHLRWYYRLPTKTALFGLTVLIVCFPYPTRLIDHLRHWKNINALIEPDAQALQPWLQELRPMIRDDLSPLLALKVVELFVYKKVPYEWDWNTWGVVDYLPTVSEVIEQGKEDCDGRAVIAASLLTNLGYKAELVTDYAHMWVKTDKGETMSPGKTQVIVATEKGLKIKLQGLTEIPRAWAFGVAVFPLVRELIIAGMLWLLLLRRHGGRICNTATLIVFVGGLLLLRHGGENYYEPMYWMEGTGVFMMLFAMTAMILWSRHNARKASNRTLAADPSVSQISEVM